MVAKDNANTRSYIQGMGIFCRRVEALYTQNGIRRKGNAIDLKSNLEVEQSTGIHPLHIAVFDV